MQSEYLNIMEIHTTRADRQSKGEAHPITCHEVPEGEKRYNSTLSLTSALDGWVVNTTPRPLRHRERELVPIVQEAWWAPGPV